MYFDMRGGFAGPLAELPGTSAYADMSPRPAVRKRDSKFLIQCASRNLPQLRLTLKNIKDDDCQTKGKSLLSRLIAQTGFCRLCSK